MRLGIDADIDLWAKLGLRRVCGGVLARLNARRFGEDRGKVSSYILCILCRAADLGSWEGQVHLQIRAT